MLQPKLHINHQIGVDDVFVPARPRAHALTAARLIRILPAGVELAIGVFGDVQIVIRKLGALVVVAFRIRNHFLERRRMDLVSDWLPIDRVAHGSVLDLKDAVGVGIKVEACRSLNERFLDGVAHTVGVEV